jgi:hypothetical protein
MVATLEKRKSVEPARLLLWLGSKIGSVYVVLNRMLEFFCASAQESGCRTVFSRGRFT